MKKMMKRVLSLLLTVMMVLSVISTGVFAVEAEDPVSVPETTQAYVLGSTTEEEYAYNGYWGLASTPYRSLFKIIKDNEEKNMTDNACLFNLISPDKLENTADEDKVGPWASILCYCVDVRVDIHSDSRYRRINLEDSGYFDQDAAELIRSIVLNGITAKTPAEVQAAVNEWLEEQEKEPLTDVTAEEVLAAAQYAIWVTANYGEILGEPTIYDQNSYATWYGVWNHEADHEYAFSVPVGEENVKIYSRKSDGDNTRTNIETLAAYYLDLEGTSAEAVAISDVSLEINDVTWEKQSDGTWNATVTFTVSDEIELDTCSDLTVTASCGEVSAYHAVEETGEDTLTLEGLASNSGIITVALNGYQTVSDVFYFDSLGDRYSSQTLVGYDDSTLPVHAEQAVGSVGVSKVWADNNNAQGLRPESIDVQLLADEEACGDPVTLSAENDWSYTWQNLPLWTGSSESGTAGYEPVTGRTEIVYSVQEIETDGYIETVTGSAAEGFVITNTVKEQVPDLIGIPVKKVWSGVSDEATLPESVTVNLLKNEAPAEVTLTLSDENNWSGFFTNLPKYDDDGNEITYTVTEESVEGYTTTITGSVAEGFVVTNTKTPTEPGPSEDTVQISVKKVWSGVSNEDTLPEFVTVRLLKNGEATRMSLQLQADNGWEGTFADLPKCDDNGGAITYTIAEVSVEGYTTTITGSAANGFVVTNTKTPTEPTPTPHNDDDDEPVRVSVAVRKVWENVGEGETLPASVTIRLLANGEETGKTLTLSAENGWKGTFSRLNKTDSRGNAITYTVAETPVAGFATTVTGSMENGFTVTNAKDAPKPSDTPATVQFAVTAEKTLDGRPVTGFAFQLKDEQGTVLAETSAKSGKVTFPAQTYAQPGTYVYTVSEKAGSNPNVIYDSAVYTVTVTVREAGDGLSASCTVTKNGAESDTVRFDNTYSGDEEFYDDEDFELFEEDIPLGAAQAPKTGDASALWAALAVASGLGLAALNMPRRRKKEN